MRNVLRAVVALGAACCAAGFGAALLYVIPYAIVELYLSGHSTKPLWFDMAAEVLLFAVAGSAAVATGVIVWRSNGGNGA